MKHIIIIGSPVSGLEFIGPFETAQDALDHADRYIDDRDWWVSELALPEQPTER